MKKEISWINNIAFYLKTLGKKNKQNSNQSEEIE